MNEFAKVQLITEGLVGTIFPKSLELISGVNETYELELAFLESRLLNEAEIIRNSAYFGRCGDQLTRHYLMCKGEPIKLPQYSSERLKSFFQVKQFKTGYATHGLFPYRGKFHPQMIKALINVMGIKPGDIVLDPMMGSGTVPLEAKLMGIRSIGIDISPFCRFMAQVKIDGLKIPIGPIERAVRNSRKVYEFFSSKIKMSSALIKKASLTEIYFTEEQDNQLLDEVESQAIFNFLLLAYLDSVGYAERSQQKNPLEQFHAIMERYLFVVEKIQRSIAGIENELAEAVLLEDDARSLPIDNQSMDGIIVSPPYSFAIDYLKNDAFHLEYLGANLNQLQEKMVGLRGRLLKEKYELYLNDMEKIMGECSRVLRPGKLCTIIIGTNDNQLGKALRRPTDQIKSLDDIMIEFGDMLGLKLIRKIERQITGIANTMRTESIVMLQKEF
jgi:DNA modification methylase